MRGGRRTPPAARSRCFPGVDFGAPLSPWLRMAKPIHVPIRQNLVVPKVGIGETVYYAEYPSLSIFG